jgi:hypothetical protein
MAISVPTFVLTIKGLTAFPFRRSESHCLFSAHCWGKVPGLLNPKKIVAHGVLGRAKFFGHVAVRQTIGNELHYVVFTLC